MDAERSEDSCDVDSNSSSSEVFSLDTNVGGTVLVIGGKVVAVVVVVGGVVVVVFVVVGVVVFVMWLRCARCDLT